MVPQKKYNKGEFPIDRYNEVAGNVKFYLEQISKNYRTSTLIDVDLIEAQKKMDRLHKLMEEYKNENNQAN